MSQQAQTTKKSLATKDNAKKSMGTKKSVDEQAYWSKKLGIDKIRKNLNRDFYTPDNSQQDNGENQVQAIKSIIPHLPKLQGHSLAFFEHNNASYEEKAAKSLAYKNGLPFNNSLKKSLTTGYGVSPSTQLNGAATRVQSLDAKIKNVTFGTNDFTLYPDLLRNGVINANSTVEEYVRFLKHGQLGHSLFQHEIGITDISTPNLRQETVYMKYLTATRQESFVAQIVNSIEDADRINELDALVTIGKTIEWACFYGDSSLTKDTHGQGVEFDGLLKLTDHRNIFSADGHSLTPEMLNRAATLIAQGFGTATDAYMPVGVKADFNNQFLGAQRIMMPTRRGYTAGTDVNRFISVRGDIALHGSTVMDMDNVLDPEDHPHPSAPDRPTIVSITKHKGGTEDTKVTAKKRVFTGNFRYDENDPSTVGKYVVGELGADPSAKNNKDTDKAQNLEYCVVACSTKGDSEPSNAVKISDFKIDPSTVGPHDYFDIGIRVGNRRVPDYVAVYRKGIVNGDYWLIKRVATKNMNPSDDQIHVVDDNSRMPETGDVFIGEIRPTTIGLMQLLPMTRLNLAQVTDATTFSILWYGALAVYIPRRFAVIRNIRYSQFANKEENHMLGVHDTGYGPYTGNTPTPIDE